MKYELAPYDIALIAGGFTVLGALISTLFGYWLAKMLASHTARINACAQLRAAFAPALVRLDTDRAKRQFPDDPAIDAFLREGLDQHALAVEKFRPFVRNGDKASYQRAFERYRQAANDGLLVATAHEKNDPWKFLEDKIHDVLQFGNT